MTSFVVWNMASAGDGTWKTVEAADARSAAELVCGPGLRSFGIDSEICARVRALGPDEQAVLFYGEKTARVLEPA
jgi:hypothetical protein